MKSLKSLLSNCIEWSLENDQYVLKSDNEILVKIVLQDSRGCCFELDQELYIIQTEGFWNTKTIIEKDNKKLMTLRRNSSGLNGKVEFPGRKFNVNRNRNASFDQLCFLSENGIQVLKYDLLPKLRPKTILQTFEKLMDANEFILLIVLGFYAFKKIINERHIISISQQKPFTHPLSKVAM